MKVRFVGRIACFVSSTNNLSVQFISEINCLRIDQTYENQINNKSNHDQLCPIELSTIRPNAPIIIMPIRKKPRAVEVGGVKVSIKK